ncbi:MAG: molybdopterin molybdotransferase MoeA [Syntrophaceae bacterium]|jgi:molybdopterin molybdotransferase|nr:molybdopterin molybdotransferase MoeA [Syntrophaceae bacterium]
MIAVEEALQTILAGCRIQELEKVSILESAGRVIGEDIYAPRDIPFAPNSSRDGYAVRFSDTQGAKNRKPVELRVVEIVAAGGIAKKTIKAGQAARIMTGALLPRGADAVVSKEDAEEKGKTVLIKAQACEGQDIRFAGEDVRQGEHVIATGSLLRPGHIGMLAQLGKAFVYVYQRPRVAIFSTGDELVDIDTNPPPSKIVNSNSYSLAAQVLECGGIPILLGIGRDNKAELLRKFQAARRSNVVISSGGVSVGDYDFVKEAIGDIGGVIHFWRVAMRPGKPLAFGSLDGVPLFGLPGNPVSVMVSFEQFVRPYLLKMQGHTKIFRQTLRAISAQDIQKAPGLKTYLRAVIHKEKNRLVARITGNQSSGILKSMVDANAFIILAENVSSVKKGEEVVVQMLDESLAKTEVPCFD